MSAKAASKVVKQLAGSGTGQSLMDRVTQAKYSLAGSGLGKVVAKASTEEVGAPKKKHLDYLINCSNEMNVSVPLLAGLLVERTQEKSWVIVFKALITSHNLMNFGNEKFSHYLASNNCPLNLPTFSDKTSAQSYEMSLFIRRYSKYLSEKTTSYRSMAFDFCKVKRGREDGVLRTMPVDKLLKALPVLSEQLNVLLEFEAQEKDLNNPIMDAAFLLLYKDLIRLFASYNEGMMNLIEKYFTLKRQHCRVGFNLYAAFPDLQTKIMEFLATAESHGIGDKDSLGLQSVPPKVIEAMEQHLNILESKTGSDDDEEEDEPNKRPPTRPASKKPALPVPLPPSAKPSGPVRPPPPPSPARVNAPSGDVKQDLQGIHDSLPESPSNTETEFTVDDLANDELIDQSAYPSVVVSDEGLPSALQEEIIAAATSHFSESITKSNEAVKRSTEETSIHTQLGRSEPRTVAIYSSPGKRSPMSSPARSASPHPSHLPVPEDDAHQQMSDEDGDNSDRLEYPQTSPVRLNISALEVNDTTLNHDDHSGRVSPFAGDETTAYAVTTPDGSSDNLGQVLEISTGPTDVKETGLNNLEPYDAPISSGSALDDLLGLNWSADTEDANECTLKPTIKSNYPTFDAENTSDSVDTTEAVKSDRAGLDDLLSLDPLLNAGISTVSSANTTPSQPNQPLDTLPVGLKPVTSVIPIRPSVPAQPQTKNPLDALDTTLVNLASTLGGQQSWGSNIKKRTINEVGKPDV